jgi:hypothetical protein
MSALESLRIAMRALRVNKLRSALTVLGIVVGVGAVVCMVSVGAGAQVEVSEKIRTLGANLLLVMPGARDSGGARLESGTQPTLTDEDAAAIRRELPDVQVAAPVLTRSMPLVAANKNWATTVAGINDDYLVAREWQVAIGRSFTGDEIGSGSKVAIVGSIIVEELFNGRAGEPTAAWQVLGISGVESRFEAQHKTRLTPLIGRDEEIELLLRRWQHAVSGEGCVVVLTGEPGIDKSHIVRIGTEDISAARNQVDGTIAVGFEFSEKNPCPCRKPDPTGIDRESDHAVV